MQESKEVVIQEIVRVLWHLGYRGGKQVMYTEEEFDEAVKQFKSQVQTWWKAACGNNEAEQQ
ncbi:MAG: hypothetical protein ACRDF4_06370 [Rhabdochlamydiaceae bacterium]